MKPYQSPNNPKVTVIPPDPNFGKQIMERERIQSELDGELASRYSKRSEVNTRIDEINIAIRILTEHRTALEEEKEENETRIIELEKMKGIR